MVIMDIYKQEHANRISDTSLFDRPTHIAVGTGILTSGEACKLTELVAELARQEITARWRTGAKSDKARFSAVFTTGEGNGIWTEIGLFSGSDPVSDPGEMLVRDAFTYSVTRAEPSTSKFGINGDLSSLFANGVKLTISESTGNDGVYTVVSSTYYSESNLTKILVDESIVSDMVDGLLTYHYCTKADSQVKVAVAQLRIG